MELQICTRKPGTPLKKILNSHRYWLDSSLYIYVEDIKSFCSNYEEIFSGGTYQNLRSDMLDIYGVNYYSPAQLKDIILKIEEQKPLDYEIILEWLKKAEIYNGFYILGI